MISHYAENSLRKHNGFTFGLNEKDIVKREEKSSHLHHLLYNEASERDEQRLFSPWRHLPPNRSGHFECFREDSTTRTPSTHTRFPKEPVSPRARKRRSLQSELHELLSPRPPPTQSLQTPGSQASPAASPWPGVLPSEGDCELPLLAGQSETRPMLTQHAPGSYDNQHPGQNAVAHQSPPPPGEPASYEVSVKHSLPTLSKYLPPHSSVSHSSSFSIISNASISSLQSASMESMGWSFLSQLTLGLESSSVSDCS